MLMLDAAQVIRVLGRMPCKLASARVLTVMQAQDWQAESTPGPWQRHHHAAQRSCRQTSMPDRRPGR